LWVRAVSRWTIRSPWANRAVIDANSSHRASGTIIRETSFGEFLRNVPLDKDGAVMFPGSPELWMVIKGKAGSVGNTGKLLKKIHKKVAPDVEDEILLRLGRTHYTADKTARTELQNFLAVVRVEEHRDDPLDEESALLLAQHSAQYASYYPYFATLTALTSREFAQFFQFAGHFVRGTARGSQRRRRRRHDIFRVCAGGGSGFVRHRSHGNPLTPIFGEVCYRQLVGVFRCYVRCTRLSIGNSPKQVPEGKNVAPF